MNHFHGNQLFATDNMVMMQSISRKDDLEQLMQLCCMLFKGKLPIFRFMEQNLNKVGVKQFMSEVIQFRQKNREWYYDQLKSMLPGHFQTAFLYIASMRHDQNPNYDLIKFWLTPSPDQENWALKSQLKVKNNEAMQRLFYVRDPPRNGQNPQSNENNEDLEYTEEFEEDVQMGARNFNDKLPKLQSSLMSIQNRFKSNPLVYSSALLDLDHNNQSEEILKNAI